MRALGWAADDSRSVQIAERLPRAEFVGLNFPGEVLPGEEWAGTVTIRNLEASGSSPFRYRVTGPFTKPSDVWLWPFWAQPGGGLPFPYLEWPMWHVLWEGFFTLGAGGQVTREVHGKGAQNFSMYLDFLEWIEVDTYHASIGLAGSAGGARATGQVRFQLEPTLHEVETDVLEVSVGETPPGTLPNLYLDETGANFPESVGADEAWSGNIPICNSGATSLFAFEVRGEASPMYYMLREGERVDLTINGSGPAEFTIHLYEPKWVEQGRLDVEVPYHRGTPGVAEGKLANLVVPNDPTPTLSVDVFNAGWEVGTFKLLVGGVDEYGPWDLAPLELRTVNVSLPSSGTYLLNLERYTDEGWVLEDSLGALVPPMVYVSLGVFDNWRSPAPDAVVEFIRKHHPETWIPYPFLEDRLDKSVIVTAHPLDEPGSWTRVKIASKVYGEVWIKWMGNHYLWKYNGEFYPVEDTRIGKIGFWP